MAKIPEGFSTVTPTLVVNGAAKAIEQYKKAFGATETYRLNCADSGKIMHACIQVGTSKIFLCDTHPEMCAAPTQSNFYLYFKDVDATFKQAKQAGMQESSPVQDMFWGDRYALATDPSGTPWGIATHIEDVPPEAMKERMMKQMAEMGAEGEAAPPTEATPPPQP